MLGLLVGLLGGPVTTLGAGALAAGAGWILSRSLKAAIVAGLAGLALAGYASWQASEREAATALAALDRAADANRSLERSLDTVEATAEASQRALTAERDAALEQAANLQATLDQLARLPTAPRPECPAPDPAPAGFEQTGAAAAVPPPPDPGADFSCLDERIPDDAIDALYRNIARVLPAGDAGLSFGGAGGLPGPR